MPDPLLSSVPDDIRRELDRYTAAKWIESWEHVTGRGIVLVAGDMHEWTLRTEREAFLYLGALAGAACAIHDGTARDGG